MQASVEYAAGVPTYGMVMEVVNETFPALKTPVRVTVVPTIRREDDGVVNEVTKVLPPSLVVNALKTGVIAGEIIGSTKSAAKPVVRAPPEVAG